MYENQGIKINAIHAISYAYDSMQIIDKLEPLTLMEKMKHGNYKTCGCERCSAFEKYYDEFVEKSNKEIEKLAEVIQFVEDSALESKEYSTYIMNTLTALSFKKDIGVVMTPSFLYKIYNEDDYDTIKRLVNDKKAQAFYNENKQMIMEKIQSEARDFGYTEQELLNKIYEGQNCQNGTETQKQIALARYSIFNVAKEFVDTMDYMEVGKDALRSAAIKIDNYYKNESIKEYDKKEQQEYGKNQVRRKK